MLWAWSFGRAAHVRSSAGAIAVLGIGTWLIYVADRLLDGRFGARIEELRERHLFHASHRRTLLLAAAVAAVPLLCLILISLSPAARCEDTLLFAASGLYFAIVHLRPIRLRHWLRREFAVGIIFASATAVPAWSQPGAAHADLLLPTFLFAALCCLNCLAIETWEQTSFAATLRTSPISAGALIMAAAAAVSMLSASRRNSASCDICAAALLSALILYLLDRLYHRSHHQPSAVPALALRIAADAALLTPLFFLFPWRP